MNVISLLLKNPKVWVLSQKIFGDNREKMNLYRSVVKRKGKILDFGCANGNTFLAFKDFEYFGFDTDKAMIRDAKARYKAYENAHFYNIDLLEQKSPENGFDFVLFALTGHHMSDATLARYFAVLSKLLKKGGKILYFDSIRQPGKDSLLLKFLLKLDQGKFVRTQENYDRIRQLLPSNLKIARTKFFQVTGTLMPQPKYLYWEIQKK